MLEYHVLCFEYAMELWWNTHMIRLMKQWFFYLKRERNNYIRFLWQNAILWNQIFTQWPKYTHRKTHRMESFFFFPRKNRNWNLIYESNFPIFRIKPEMVSKYSLNIHNDCNHIDNGIWQNVIYSISHLFPEIFRFYIAVDNKYQEAHLLIDRIVTVFDNFAILLTWKKNYWNGIYAKMLQ